MKLENKNSDLDSKIVSSARGQELARRLDISFIETSAKTGHNVDNLFKLLASEML